MLDIRNVKLLEGCLENPNSELSRIVSNSAKSGEQWQIVVNSDEQSSIVI